MKTKANKHSASSDTALKKQLTNLNTVERYYHE